jgi:hypothetical protein
MNTGPWDSFYIEDSSTTYLDGVSFPNGLVVSFTVLPYLGGLLIPPEQTMFLDQRADFSSLDVSLVSSPPQILYQLDTYYLTRSSDTGPSIVDITSVDSASDAPQTDGSSNVTAGDTPQKESASQNSGSLSTARQGRERPARTPRSPPHLHRAAADRQMPGLTPAGKVWEAVQLPAVIKHTTKRCLVFPLGKSWSLRTQTSIRYQGLMN